MSRNKYFRRAAKMTLTVLAAAALVASNANAQKQWQTRTWPELKAETQARADRNAPNSPGKKRSAAKAQAAFLAYGQLLEPKIEVLRIPFEGKEIVAYLQKPASGPKPPIVLDIGGVDEWKDAGADVAVDMPGTGEAPLQGAEWR